MYLSRYIYDPSNWFYHIVVGVSFQFWFLTNWPSESARTYFAGREKINTTTEEMTDGKPKREVSVEENHATMFDIGVKLNILGEGIWLEILFPTLSNLIRTFVIT